MRSAAIDELVAKIKATKRDEWQYLEVKQMAEILFRQREKLRAAIKRYRGLKASWKAEKDEIEKLYAGYEMMFARDHLRDDIRLYLLVNRDYHEAFSSYMDDIKSPSKVKITPIHMVDEAKTYIPKRPLQGRKSAA